MITTWMFGATLFTLLLALAAFASERVLRLSQRATRTPWAMALVVAIVWPVVASSVLQQFKTAELPAAVETSVPSSAASIIAEQLPDVAATWSERLGVALLLAWALLSVAMLTRLAFAAFVLARITRKSRAMELDGASVIVTESLGPAVVGLWRPQVAVPDWFLGLDEPLRKLVLHHELEHCRSRDPQLVWLASLAVALMPWNVGMWFLSRRLRLALEIDCDARTLRREGSTERYGKLLLLIAQRQSSYPLVSMLAESTSHLSQRITAMHKKPLHRPAARIAMFTGVAVAALAVACSPRISSDLTGPSNRPQSLLAAKNVAEKMSGDAVYFESQVENPVVAAPGSVGPKYPADLKAQGVEGRVMLMVVVDTNGRADIPTVKVLNSSRPEFTTAVQEALPQMRFLPAQIGGRKVRQLVQLPMVFDIGNNGIAGETRNTIERSVKVETGAPTQLPAAQKGVYFASQVEVPARTSNDGKFPAFPAPLKSAGVEGRVLAQFVVNEDGTMDLSTFRVLKSDHLLFETAVREALPGMRFTSASIGGKAVKQLVQQPFDFMLPR